MRQPLQMREKLALYLEYQAIPGQSGPVVAVIAGDGLNRVKQKQDDA
jgi:hypothetical protein